MIIVCRVCGKQVGQTPKGRGIERGWCRVCGLRALAEEDMLTREEADELQGVIK
jgi:hypothetical protein